MTSTADLRKLWGDYLCDSSEYERVTFPGPSSDWSLYVARPAQEAFQAFSSIMEAHGYLFRESAGGTYSCRTIGGSEEYSLHAYAIAIDLNPSKNGFGQCSSDMPQAFRDEILSLRTGNGKRVFSWGGDWRPCSSADPMHWQIDVGPADLETGVEMALSEADLNKIRELVVEVLGGDRIEWQVPGQDYERAGNQGVLNSALWPIYGGSAVVRTLEEIRDDVNVLRDQVSKLLDA